MSSLNSRHYLCEKHAKEYDPVTLKKITPEENKSICSCPKCDSLECFVIRNKHCPCEQDTCQPSTLTKYNTDKSECYNKSTNKGIEPPQTNVKQSYHYTSQLFYRNNTGDKSAIDPTAGLSATCSGKNVTSLDTNTAKLSAQIMDVPYEDFKETISGDESKNESPKPMLSIISRIKEAYKACSCKVCECIIGKSECATDYCSCKPCECYDCKTLLNKIIGNRGNVSNKNKLSCSCTRCDRKIEGNACDCDKYNFVKGTDIIWSSEPCNCKPCECLECKLNSAKTTHTSAPKKNNTFVVASLREEVPRAFCRCTPCDCPECSQGYTRGSVLRHEMSTGINRPLNCTCDSCINQECEAHDSSSCTCDVHKQLMRKPVENDTRDYDIHRASVIKKFIERKNKNDTIAMFAAVENRFPQYHNLKTNSCNCGDCECIVCDCKGSTENFHPSIYRSLYTENLDRTKQSKNINTCKCTPCECVTCDYLDLNRKNDCTCDMCECLKCDSLSEPSTSNAERHKSSIQFKNIIPTNACKCSPCDCHDCKKMMYKCTGDSSYCANCKCQMCTDQTNFFNETVFGNRINDLPFHIKGKKVVDRNDGNTFLPQYDNKHSIQIESKQNLSMNNNSSSFSRRKDSLLRQYSQVRIPDNSKDQKIVHVCDAYAECGENKLVQCYAKTPEYKSSRSFSNTSLSGEHTCLRKSTHNNILMKTKKSLDDFTNYSSSTKNNDWYEDTSQSFVTTNENNNHNIITNCPYYYNSKKNILRHEFSAHNEFSHYISDLNKQLPAKSETGKLVEQDQEITNVKDLSHNLVVYLRNANERLSAIMKRQESYNRCELEPFKADTILPKRTSLRKYMSNVTENDLSQDYFLHYNEDYSDINHYKVTTTLQQAKVFSMELTKILKNYKEANRKFDSRFLRKNNDANAVLDKLNNKAISREQLFSGDQKPFTSAYEPAKKYGSHKLKVLINKENIFDTKGRQIAKISHINKSMPESKSDNVTHDVGDDINEYTNVMKNKYNDRNDSRLSDGSILLTELRRKDEDDEPLELYTNSYNQENESVHSSDPDKNKNNICSNKSHIPSSDVSGRKLKFREALINLANQINVDHSNLVPQSIQCDTTESAEIVDETTQHEQHVEKPETTSTSTDAPRAVSSRFSQPIQDIVQKLESWSILKKNCLINSADLENGKILLMPPLFLDIKDALTALTSQDGEAGRSESNDAVTVTGHANRALLKLQSEVSKLKSSMIPSESESNAACPIGKGELDLKSEEINIASSHNCNVMANCVEKSIDCMDNTFSVAILQRQVRELLNLKSVHRVVDKSLKADDVSNPDGTSELTISTSSCDTLKVKFLGLRRVSDHTVLVKWKVPHDLTTVQGYELLVDGRAVQKMLSPSKCMAVVTCLPHIEKVLITIRTLVANAEQTTHYPSATAVYRTRGK